MEEGEVRGLYQKGAFEGLWAKKAIIGKRITKHPALGDDAVMEKTTLFLS